MLLLCTPKSVSELFDRDSLCHKDVKWASESGCPIVPIVHKSYRGVSPFLSSHEVATDESGFLIFHEHEVKSLFKQTPLFHYTDSEDGLNLMMNEMCIRMGWSHDAQIMEEGGGGDDAHTSPNLGLSDLKDLLHNIGASATSRTAILSAAPKGLGIKSVHELRGVPRSGLQGAPCALPDSQYLSLCRTLQAWPRLSTMPRWLRSSDPALQQVLLSLLESIPCPGTISQRLPTVAGGSIQGIQSYHDSHRLDLSALGAAGKVGKVGAAAVAGLLTELKAVQSMEPQQNDLSPSYISSPMVTTISLHGCGLDAASACLVLNAALGLRGLRDIDLGGNMLAGKGQSLESRVKVAEELGDLLGKCGGLTHVGLAGIGYSDKMCSALLMKIARNHGSITHVDLCGNFLGPHTIRAFAFLNLRAAKLSDVILLGSDESLSLAAVKSLYQPASKQLEHADLSHCGLGFHFSRALKETQSVEEGRPVRVPPHFLDLTGNNLLKDRDATTALCDALMAGSLKDCQGLLLAWNCGALQEGYLVVSALRKSSLSVLTTLDLSGTRLSGPACSLLAKHAMPALPALTQLKVEECGLNSRDMSLLVAAAQPLPLSVLKVLERAVQTALEHREKGYVAPHHTTLEDQSTFNTLPSALVNLEDQSTFNTLPSALVNFLLGQNFNTSLEPLIATQLASDSSSTTHLQGQHYRPMTSGSFQAQPSSNMGALAGNSARSLSASTQQQGAGTRGSRGFNPAGSSLLPSIFNKSSLSPAGGSKASGAGAAAPRSSSYGKQQRAAPAAAIAARRSPPRLTLDLPHEPAYHPFTGLSSTHNRGVTLTGIYAQLHIMGAKVAATTNAALYDSIGVTAPPGQMPKSVPAPPRGVMASRKRGQSPASSPSSSPQGGGSPPHTVFSHLPSPHVLATTATQSAVHPLLEVLLNHPLLRDILISARAAFADQALDNTAVLAGFTQQVALLQNHPTSCCLQALSMGRNKLDLGEIPGRPASAAAAAEMEAINWLYQGGRPVTPEVHHRWSAAGSNRSRSTSPQGNIRVSSPERAKGDQAKANKQAAVQDSGFRNPSLDDRSSPSGLLVGQISSSARHPSGTDSALPEGTKVQRGGTPSTPATVWGSSSWTSNPRSPNAGSMLFAATPIYNTHHTRLPPEERPGAAAALGAALGFAMCQGQLKHLSMPGTLTDSTALIALGLNSIHARQLVEGRACSSSSSEADALSSTPSISGVVTGRVQHRGKVHAVTLQHAAFPSGGLQSLDLYDCGLSARHGLGLSLLLVAAGSGLRQLVLDYNILSQALIRTGLKPALGTGRACPNLTRITANHALRDVAAATELMELAGSCVNLETLCLSSCPLDSVVIRSLASCFKGWNRIKSVVLGGVIASSPIGPPSLSFLAQMIAGSTLSFLSLPGIGLKDADVKGLSKVISTCATLNQLDLSSNDLTAAGGRYLIDAITTRLEEGLPRLVLDVTANAIPVTLLSKINERSEAAAWSGEALPVVPQLSALSQWMGRSRPNGYGAQLGLPLLPEELPVLRPLVRMPQSRHVVPVEELGELGGKGGKMESRSKEEDRELARQLLESASTPFKQPEEAEVIVAKCRALLESGAYADSRELPGDENSEHEQWTPLMHAANTGNAKLVHLLLEKGADINAKTEEGWTAMLVASKCGNLEVCKELLGHASKPNMQSRVVLRNQDDLTALHLAAQAGNADTVSLLIKHGADLNAEDRSGCSVPLAAAAAGHWEVLKVVLGSRGLSKDSINAQARMPTANKDNQEGLQQGSKSQKIQIPEDDFDVSALYLAAEKGVDASCKLLIEKGAHFDMHEKEQLEGLFSRIVERKQWSILRLLLTSSVCQSSNVVDALNVRVESEELGLRWGTIPLVLVVAMNNQEELCNLMMQTGVDMNAMSTSGYTPLLLAVDKEDIKLVRTLLTSVISNSEVRVAMLEKRFPLLELQMFEVNAVGLATVREDPDIVQALLEFGASPEDVEEVEALMGGDTPTSPTSPYSPGSCQAGSIMSLLSPGGNATNMVRPSFALAENLRNSLSLEPLLGGSHVDLLPENQEQAAEEEGAVPGDLLPENQEQADDDEGDVPGDLLPEHQEQAAEEEGAVPGDPSAEVELSILGDLEEEEQAEDEAENTDHQERVRESGQEQLLSGASDHNERVRESGQEQLLSGASDHHTGISADSVQAAGADIAAATSTNGTAQSPDTGADQTAATSTIDTTSLSSDATAATTEVGQVEEEAPTSTDNAELVGQLEEEAPLATDIAGFSQDKEEAPTTITDTSVFSQEEEEARPTATANETADAAVVNPEASEKVPTAAA